MLTVFIDNTNDSRKKREWKDIPWSVGVLMAKLKWIFQSLITFPD